ncbi:hypothetical protein ES703_78732 [subsurface metagenome]
MVRNGEVVEGVANDQVILAFRQLRYRHARILVVAHDASVWRQPQIVKGDAGNLRVDFDDLQGAFGVHLREILGHYVAATSNEQDLHAWIPLGYVSRYVSEDLLITGNQESGVF